MSNSNTVNGGVRNLAAIFENKATEHSTSPPSRGRSPNGSVNSSHSRPVSKVRTSFVAVERPGEAGGPPTLGLRKASDVEMEKTNKTAPKGDESQASVLGHILKGSPFEPTSSPQKASAIPNSSSSHAAFAVPKHEKQADSPKVNGNSDRAASMVERMKQPESKHPPPHTSLVTGGQPIKPLPTRQTHPKPVSPVESKKSPTTPTSAGPVAKPRGGVAKIQGVMDSANKAKASRESTSSTADPNSPKTGGPVAHIRGGVAKIQGVIESANKAKEARASEHVDGQADSPSTKGPVAKPRGGVTKIQGVMDSANKAKEARAAHESNTETSAPTATGPVARPRGGVTKIQGVIDSANKARESRAVAAKTTESPTTTAVKEKTNGIKKTTAPSPRTSTGPTRLPSAATATTAASAAKTDVARTEAKPTEPKPVGKGALRIANTSTASSLAKKTSRASLNTNERPRSRVSAVKPADESFLARMTRPTASSAQKAHDKIQATSPPQTRRTSVGRKDLAKRPSRQSLGSADKVPEDKKEHEASNNAYAVAPVLEAPEDTKDEQLADMDRKQSQQAETPAEA